MKPYLLLLLVAFSACKKSPNAEPNPTDHNGEPTQVYLSLTEIGWDTATLHWTASTDPDNDSVAYSIYLDGNLVNGNLAQTDFILRNLKPTTQYRVKLIASDNHDHEKSAELTITTTPYYLKFLKRFDYGPPLNPSMRSIERMIKANDDGYLLVGKADLPDRTTYPLKYFALKIDILGNEIWRNYYEDDSSGSYEANVAAISDGYILGGSRQLLKIDNNGNLIWSHAFRTDEYLISSIAVNSSGEIYTVGSAGASQKLSEAALTKWDRNGNLIWNKKFSKSVYERFVDVKTTSDGNLIVLGGTDANKISWDEYVSGAPFDEDFWVLKFDGDGNIIWSEVYKDPGTASPTTIIQLKNGNYVFGGFTLLRGGFAYMRMLDPNGNSLWEYFNPENATWINSIAETNDNSLITTGAFEGFEYMYFSMYKYDMTGNELWGKIYQEGGVNIIGKDVISTPDNGYIAASKKFFFGDEIYLFKTDSEGSFEY